MANAETPNEGTKTWYDVKFTSKGDNFWRRAGYEVTEAEARKLMDGWRNNWDVKLVKLTLAETVVSEELSARY